MCFMALFLVMTIQMNTAFAEVRADSQAPEFSLMDMTGKERKLSDFSGKYIVLEWFNKDCPYVKKHYESSNMQNLQKKYTKLGVVWLTIYSSAKGKQGHETPAEALKTHKDLDSSSSHLLADSDGVVGKLFGAKTTPHIFIINPNQKVIYAGAIDDNSSANPADIATSKNYLSLALDAALAGKTVEVRQTKPYGCGVKY